MDFCYPWRVLAPIPCRYQRQLSAFSGEVVQVLSKATCSVVFSPPTHALGLPDTLLSCYNPRAQVLSLSINYSLTPEYIRAFKFTLRDWVTWEYLYHFIWYNNIHTASWIQKLKHCLSSNYFTKKMKSQTYQI